MFLWTHSDPRGLDKANLQAKARALSGGWGVDAIGQSEGTRAEDLLVLIAASLVVRQELIDVGKADDLVPSGNKLSFTVAMGSAPDIDHQNAQVLMIRTWEVLARSEGWNDSSAQQLSATTGKDASAQANAVAIVAIVVGILAVAAILAFVVWNVNTLIDRQLTRRAQAQELMRAHAECQDMLEKHAAAEKAAGHAIEFSTVELQIMARLARAQDSVLHNWSQSITASNPTTPKNPSDPWTAVQTIGSLAVVSMLVYFLFRREI